MDKASEETVTRTEVRRGDARQQCVAASNKGIRCMKPARLGRQYCMHHMCQAEPDDSFRSFMDKPSDDSLTGGDELADVRQLCVAVSAKGTPCKMRALPGQAYCHLHIKPGTGKITAQVLVSHMQFSTSFRTVSARVLLLCADNAKR